MYLRNSVINLSIVPQLDYNSSIGDSFINCQTPYISCLVEQWGSTTHEHKWQP